VVADDAGWTVYLDRCANLLARSADPR
jgi:hypothetical protein